MAIAPGTSWEFHFQRLHLWTTKLLRWPGRLSHTSIYQEATSITTKQRMQKHPQPFQTKRLQGSFLRFTHLSTFFQSFGMSIRFLRFEAWKIRSKVSAICWDPTFSCLDAFMSLLVNYSSHVLQTNSSTLKKNSKSSSLALALVMQLPTCEQNMPVLKCTWKLKGMIKDNSVLCDKQVHQSSIEIVRDLLVPNSRFEWNLWAQRLSSNGVVGPSTLYTTFLMCETLKAMQRQTPWRHFKRNVKMMSTKL